MSTLKGFGTSKLPLYPKVNLGQGPPGSWFWKYVGCGTLSDKKKTANIHAMVKFTKRSRTFKYLRVCNALHEPATCFIRDRDEGSTPLVRWEEEQLYASVRQY